MTKLSELEGAVLGLIWSDGPLTAYAIRSRFLNSRSSHFSGSAGAIYPLVERLRRAGLVGAVKRMTGQRTSKIYRTTPAGKKALHTWLLPLEGWMAAVEFDPIRTRVHFLGALAPRHRRRFLREAAERLEDEVEATQILIRDLTDEGDRWKIWGARGALIVLRARRRWIREIQKADP
jgi:DNA-binding PadR family transcriptional regulator